MTRIIARFAIMAVCAAFLSTGGCKEDKAMNDGGTDAGAAIVWYDSTSNLCWQDPPWDTMTTYQEACNYCNSLTLGGSGEWKAPTITQLRTLIRNCPVTETGGACAVKVGSTFSDDWTTDCLGCDSLGGPSAEGWYWDPDLAPLAVDAANTSFQRFWSTSQLSSIEAWTVHFGTAEVHYKSSGDNLYTRCVLLGQCP